MAANPLAAGRSLPRDSCSSIVRCVSPMKRIFSSRVFPLAVGLGLRLLFVLLVPATSGDTVLYEQIATNWLKHHAYAMDVHGALTPVDIRMPGYPAFLALIYALTGRTGESARWWVMLAQIPVDLLGCLVIARLAGMLTCPSGNDARGERAYTLALWLAAVCPFTANYTAVPLTEVFACFWTALACCVLVVAIETVKKPDFLLRGSEMPSRRGVEYAALGAGLIAGMGALFRPETPLLLLTAAIVLGVLLLRLAIGSLVFGRGGDDHRVPDRAVSLGFAQPADIQRSAISQPEIFDSSRRDCPLRLHGLGKDLAVPRARLLSGALEA